MEIQNIILGTHDGPTWVVGVLWSLVGIATVKLYYYKAKSKFNLTYWLNDNLKDVILGILLTLVVLRLGDFALVIIERVSGFDTEEIEDAILPVLIASIYIQNHLHKRGKPISGKLKEKIKANNEG